MFILYFTHQYSVSMNILALYITSLIKCCVYDFNKNLLIKVILYAYKLIYIIITTIKQYKLLISRYSKLYF